MKKLLPICIFLFAGISQIKAQEHEFHGQVTSEIWESISRIKHNVIDDYEYYPIFSDEMKALDGRTVTLKGYMVPIKEGFHHTSFLLSVLPISQCFFCGKNGIPMMIEVKLRKPVSYSEKVVSVKGVINLRQVNAAYSCPVVINGATLLE
ncbi:MAG: hypothetical protein H0X62_12780 [Bacteroidetes bacterium]|nr:hypothetical protein [Bacteroidota bacterium]